MAISNVLKPLSWHRLRKSFYQYARSKILLCYKIMIVMRKKFTLFTLLFTLFSFVQLNAQTTTWDFTASNPTWPSTGMGTSPIQIVDSKGLGLYGIASNANFAAWNTTSSSTWTAPNEPYASGTIRVQTNGAGFATGSNESTPTQRYFFIQVNQPCTVRVWFKSGSSSAQRSVIVSNGSTNYGKATANTGATGVPTDGAFLNANVTAAGTFFIYGDAAVNIFQIQVVGATVSLTPTNPLNTSTPVKFGAVNASLINGLAKIYWDVISEINTANYYIEKANDGNNFESIGSLTATNESKYSYIDNVPTLGASYYRIKAVDKDGKLSFSNIIRLTSKNTAADFVVTPNPIKNGTVNLQLNNFTKSDYSVSLFDASGRIAFTKKMTIEPGSSAQTLHLPNTVSKGIYQLQITNGSIKINKAVVVQ